jgi:hypothetical protein
MQIERDGKRNIFSQILLDLEMFWRQESSLFVRNTETADRRHLRSNQNNQRHNIVNCRGLRVTKITGSTSDDWIY